MSRKRGDAAALASIANVSFGIRAFIQKVEPWHVSLDDPASHASFLRSDLNADGTVGVSGGIRTLGFRSWSRRPGGKWGIGAINSTSMKTATVSEVGRNFGTVLDWVKAGEEVQVLEGETPVAVISPPRPSVQHPDYAARVRQTFGQKVLTETESEELRRLNRGER